MHISFIGMSGSGKSHWSSQLVAQGFKRFCCDDLIAQRLKPELTRADGTMQPMGEWMGFPYEPHYKACQQHYLQLEIEVLTEILTCLETHDYSSENIVVDTTGSVIYTGKTLLNRLAQQTQIVYLDTPIEVQKRLETVYHTEPRPILWMDKFNQRANESNQTALSRCYADLLSSRIVEYKKWTAVTLDYYILRQKSFQVADFINQLRQHQPNFNRKT